VANTWTEALEKVETLPPEELPPSVRAFVTVVISPRPVSADPPSAG
jgi:hypothetical protein